MADPVALVSIVSGATVAVAVPFINARLERSRIHHQSRDARMDELRALLDGAVRNLYDAWAIVYEVDQEARRMLPRPDWSDDRLRELAKKLTSQTDVVIHDGLRIGLRAAAGAAIADTQDRARTVVLEYELALRQFVESETMQQERPPEPPVNELSLAISAFMEAIREFVGVVEPPPRPSDVSPT
jgi:hypothetical protein